MLAKSPPPVSGTFPALWIGASAVLSGSLLARASVTEQQARLQLTRELATRKPYAGWVEETVRFFAVDGLRKAMPRVDLRNAAPVVRGCRMIKSPAELALMQAANDIMLKYAPQLTKETARAQLQIAIDHLMVDEVRRNGAGPMSQPIPQMEKLVDWLPAHIPAAQDWLKVTVDRARAPQ